MIARLTGTTCSYNNAVYSIPDTSELYDDVNSTTYTKITRIDGKKTANNLIISGFDFSSIPSDIVVNSCIFQLKCSLKSRTALVANSNGGGLRRSVSNIRTDDLPAVVRDLISPPYSTAYPTIQDWWERLASLGSTLTFTFGIQAISNDDPMDVWSEVYGANLYVDYDLPASNKLYFKSAGSWVEASKAYKKTNGVWVEQTDLTTVFDSSTNYVKGN